jgi:polysaccharide pyruvyl transferase WcaK-like protein
LIAARESNSFDYLKSIGLNAVQAFDTALLAPEEENKSTIRFVPQKKYCLFTGSNIKKYDLLDIANTISDKGFSPIYIPLGLNDYEDFARLKKSNVDCFEFNELSYSELLEVIRNAEIVVSGRHHLNILSLAVAKPFVPLESNTWKIDGVCKMLGYRTQFDIDLSLRIDDVLLNKEAIICKFTNHSKTLMKLAKLNLT